MSFENVLGNKNIYTDLLLTGQLSLDNSSSITQTGKYIQKEDNVENYVIQRIDNSNNITTLMTLTPTGDLSVNGSFVGVDSDTIKDNDNTTSITTQAEPETILFNTNSLERMAILSNGNVGIGITNPSSILDINGTLELTNDIRFNNTTNSIYFGSTTTQQKIVGSGNDLVLYTSATERMRIKNTTGNVGINKTSPSQKLEVGDGNVLLSTALPATDLYYGITVPNNSSGGYFVVNSGGDMRLQQNNNAKSIRMLKANGNGLEIDNTDTAILTAPTSIITGNVGIGINPPPQKLSVGSGAVYVKQAAQTNATSGAYYNGLTLINNSTAHSYGIGYNVGGSLGFNYYDAVGDTYSNYMTITNTGNVGLGISTPDSMFYVNDSGITTTDTIQKVLAPNLSTGNFVNSYFGRTLTGTWNAMNTRFFNNANNSLSNRLDFLWQGNATPVFTLGANNTAGITNSTPVSALDIITNSLRTTGPTGKHGLKIGSGVGDQGIHMGFDNTNGVAYCNVLQTSGGVIGAPLVFNPTGTAAGHIGIGNLTPSFNLHLANDSAAKPTSSTWTISSDMRVKENIENADLDMCYDDIKNIDLKRFKWNQQYIDKYNVEDQHSLGFIAQEVELINPKAVKTYNNVDMGIEDFKSVDKDQLLMSLFGCVKKLQEKVEQLEQKLIDNNIV